MTPDEIKDLIEASFSHIVSVRRNNPDGWAFFFKEERRGNNPSRIARAVQSGKGHVRFKLAVSERLNRAGETIVVDPDARRVRELFRRELELWQRHFQ